MKKILKKILAYTLIFCELFQATGVYALTKEENVYAKLNESGDVKSVSFSEHLYDYNGNKINDKSNLKDIKNINGNEKFTQNGENLLWETNGDNIYYKGTYEKDLPISINVKYYLDGEEKNVNDILGKKGNIKIVLNYKNNSYKNMNINGKTEKIYVPYAIVTTSILNNNDNKNIKVTNGKIIDNGVSSVVMAISSPGLYESLGVNELKNINEVEITYDTDCFELSSIYSVATTSLFDDNNLDMFGEINDLYKSINLLQSNMDTIVEASKKLSDGSTVSYFYNDYYDFKILKPLNIVTSSIYYGGSIKIQAYKAGGKPLAYKYISIKINGKFFKKVKTNKNGLATVKLGSKYTPKKYNITAVYGKNKVSKKIKVKQVLSLKKVTIKKSAKKLILTATLKKGKTPMKKRKVTFRFKGKKYTVKTNKKGIAKVTIKKSVLKKLKVGKKLTYKATYCKTTVKRTVKVKK